MRARIPLLLSLLCVAMSARALTLDEILERSRRVTAGLRDFTCVMTMQVQSTSARVPPTRVRVYYKAPDKFKPVPLDGDFAVMPQTYKIALGSVVDRLLEDHTAVLLADQTIDDRPHYVLKLKPKDDEQPVQYHLLYLDKSTFVMRRLWTYPKGDPPATVDITHQRINNIWMPVTVRMQAETTREVQGERRTERMTATMRFEGYRINTGLDDSVFRDDR